MLSEGAQGSESGALKGALVCSLAVHLDRSRTLQSCSWLNQTALPALLLPKCLSVGRPLPALRLKPASCFPSALLFTPGLHCF